MTAWCRLRGGNASETVAGKRREEGARMEIRSILLMFLWLQASCCTAFCARRFETEFRMSRFAERNVLMANLSSALT